MPWWIAKVGPPWIGSFLVGPVDWIGTWGIWMSAQHLELFFMFLWPFLRKFCTVAGCIVLLGDHSHQGVPLPWGGILALQRFLGGWFVKWYPHECLDHVFQAEHWIVTIWSMVFISPVFNIVVDQLKYWDEQYIKATFQHLAKTVNRKDSCRVRECIFLHKNVIKRTKLGLSHRKVSCSWWLRPLPILRPIGMF